MDRFDAILIILNRSVHSGFDTPVDDGITGDSVLFDVNRGDEARIGESVVCVTIRDDPVVPLGGVVM